MDFPFELAVKLDIPNAKLKKSGRPGSYDMDCPFCGGKRKFNFVGSVGHCNKCDRGFNTVTFHAELTGMSTKEAYADLKKAYYNLPREERQRAVSVMAESEGNLLVPAPLDVRDIYYREMLKHLPLADKHREDLHDRGLTDADIAKYQFASVPMVGRQLIAQKVNAVTGIGEVICRYWQTEHWQIPGIVSRGCDTEIVKRARGGFLIPVVWHDGRISGFQVRNDLSTAEVKARKEEAERQKAAKAVIDQVCAAGGVPTKEQLAAVKPIELDEGPKYSYFSSSGDKLGVGCSDIENVHFVGDGFDFKNGKSPACVCLTEGCLKADVAAALSGWSFMGILGVNMQRCLPDALAWCKQGGTKHISVCFDMDMFTNVHVMAALIKLVQKLTAAGYPLVFTGADFKFKQARLVAHALNKDFLDGLCADYKLELTGADGTKVRNTLIDLLARKITFGVTDAAKLAAFATSGMTLSASDMTTVQKYAMALVRKAQNSAKPYTYAPTDNAIPEYHSRIAFWDARYKGIDDYLLARKKEKGKYEK